MNKKNPLRAIIGAIVFISFFQFIFSGGGFMIFNIVPFLIFITIASYVFKIMKKGINQSQSNDSYPRQTYNYDRPTYQKPKPQLSECEYCGHMNDPKNQYCENCGAQQLPTDQYYD